VGGENVGCLRLHGGEFGWLKGKLKVMGIWELLCKGPSQVAGLRVGDVAL
jgi:hypothetical protein